MLPLFLLVSVSSASPIDIFGLSTVNLFHAQNSSNYCYTLDQDPYLNFGTKTAYEYTRGDLYNDQLPDSKQKQLNSFINLQILYTACEPILLWSFNRHGTRYPGPTEIIRFSRLGEVLEKIKHNHKLGKVKLCDEDYAFLST